MGARLPNGAARPAQGLELNDWGDDEKMGDRLPNGEARPSSSTIDKFFELDRYFEGVSEERARPPTERAARPYSSIRCLTFKGSTVGVTE